MGVADFGAEATDFWAGVVDFKVEVAVFWAGVAVFWAGRADFWEGVVLFWLLSAFSAATLAGSPLGGMGLTLDANDLMLVLMGFEASDFVEDDGGVTSLGIGEALGVVVSFLGAGSGGGGVGAAVSKGFMPIISIFVMGHHSKGGPAQAVKYQEGQTGKKSLINLVWETLLSSVPPSDSLASDSDP